MGLLQRLLSRFSKPKKLGKPKKKKIAYRIVYDKGSAVEETYTVKKKPKKKSTAVEKKTKDTEKIEDVEKAIEHLIEAARNVLCPFCRAKVIHLIDYFYTYHYKTLLAEAGVDPNKIDEVYEERYASIVKEKVEEIRKELGVSDLEMKQTAKEFIQELLT